jgi:hypothetical protein
MHAGAGERARGRESRKEGRKEEEKGREGGREGGRERESRKLETFCQRKKKTLTRLRDLSCAQRLKSERLLVRARVSVRRASYQVG